MKKTLLVPLLLILLSSLLTLFACSPNGKLSRSKKEEKIFLSTLAHPKYIETKGTQAMVYTQDEILFYHGQPFNFENHICAIHTDTFIQTLGIIKDGQDTFFHVKYKTLEGFIPNSKEINYYPNFDQINEELNFHYLTSEPAYVWKLSKGKNPQLLETLPPGFSFFSSKKTENSVGEEFVFIELENGEKGIVHMKSLNQFTLTDKEPTLRLICVEEIPIYNTPNSEYRKQIHFFKEGEFIFGYDEITSDDHSDYILVSFDDRYGFITEADSSLKETVRILFHDFQAYSLTDIPIFDTPYQKNRKEQATMPKGKSFHIIGQLYQNDSDKIPESGNYYYIEYKEQKGFIKTTDINTDGFLYETFKRNGVIYGIQSFIDYEKSKNSLGLISTDLVKVINGDNITERKDLLLENWDNIISFKTRSDIIKGKSLLEIEFQSNFYGRSYSGFLYYEFNPDDSIGNLIFSYYKDMNAQDQPGAELTATDFSGNSCLLEYSYLETVGFPEKGMGKITLKFQYNPQENIFELRDFKTEDLELSEDSIRGKVQQSITYHTPKSLNIRFKQGAQEEESGLFPDHDFIFGVK